MNDTNTRLLERAAEAVDIGNDMAEFWTDTTIGRVLDECIAQVKRDADTDLEGLHNDSLPLLEEKLKESARVMAEQSEAHFYANNIL